MNYYVHPSAVIDEKVDVGTGTKIWINVQIREFAKIGLNCIIGKDSYIDHHVTIGDNTKIQNSVNIFYGVTIEQDVFVGPGVTFTNDLFPRAHDDNWKVTETIVRRGASIGANSTITPGVEIGEHVMIGAGSVVTKSIEPHALVMGNPAKKIGYVCSCGQKLDDEFCCLQCGSKYEKGRSGHLSL